MLFGNNKNTQDLAEIKRILTLSAEKSDLAQNQFETIQNQNELLQNQIDTLQRQNELLLKQTEAMQNQMETLQNQLSTQEKQLTETEKQLRRQSVSFEDLLDEFQTQKEGQEKEKTQENALVTLACICREHLELLESQIRKDTSLPEEKRIAWENQFALLDKECQKQMMLCGMTETGKIGEEADYRFYEILSTADTADARLSGTVAEVYAKGRIYQGKVWKKARVAVYKSQQP